jgi:hypothetical protein
MRRRFKVLWFAASLAHLLACAALFCALFSAGMDRFDNGGPPAAWETPARWILGLLAFPVVFGMISMPVRFPAIVQWVGTLANSGLWGFGIAWLVDRLRARRAAQSGSE